MWNQNERIPLGSTPRRPWAWTLLWITSFCPQEFSDWASPGCQHVAISVIWFGVHLTAQIHIPYLRTGVKTSFHTQRTKQGAWDTVTSLWALRHPGGKWWLSGRGRREDWRERQLVVNQQIGDEGIARRCPGCCLMFYTESQTLWRDLNLGSTPCCMSLDEWHTSLDLFAPL